LSGAAPGPSGGFAATISRNILASLARVAVVSLVGLVLPAYLTHHLPVKTYAAWILILQLAAYVSYLDFGVQTGVSKFVSEYDARRDEAGAGRHASAGFALVTMTGLLGVALTLILAWQVPRLFADMPASLYRDVRISVVLVGTSMSFQLMCSVFPAIFLGLQRYAVPMTISIVNKAAFTAVVLVAVFLHGSLAAMGAGVALVNAITAVISILAWRRMAARIRVSFALMDYCVLKKMARYCSLLCIMSAAMLCITGFDVTIVGHYDYIQTAYYSIATLPTSFVILIISSMVHPLLPASSAMSTHRSVSDMGDVLATVTRYAIVILLLSGLPLMVCGLPILRLWVGSVYALHTLKYLRILVLANIVRNFCAPYAAMMCATGRQGAATISAICEAVTNLGSSIYFASRFGAIGVAYGTLLGAFVGVLLHFAVSMHFTHQTLAISRARLFLWGLLRPAIIAVPSVLILPFWCSSSHLAPNASIASLWAISTLLLAWFGGLNRDERTRLVHLVKKRLSPLA
jgi:O-antigen/teichoic acid export membrane protein